MLKYWNKYHHSIWSGILLSIRTLAGFGVQKLVAIFYGPAGTTLFSHFQNFVALFTQPIQDAVANGLINAFPKKEFKNRQLIGAAVLFLIILAFSTGVLLLIANQFQKSYFSFSFQSWALIIPAILLFCFGLIVSAVYVVERKLKLYSCVILIQWILFFSSVFTLDLELYEFLIFWLAFQSLFSVFLVIPVYSYLRANFKVDKKVRDHFRQFILMALTIWLSSKWVDYFVREYSIQEFGTFQTGLWQSVERISGAYRGLVISFLFLSFYPILSKKLASGKLQFGILRKYYLRYLLFSLLFLFLVFQFNEFILKTLYADLYVEAGMLFRYQIIGDIFAFLAIPFSIYLIASVKTKTYIITELISALIFVTLIVMNTSVGVEILVYAHIFRFIGYSAMVSMLGIKGLKDVR